MKFENHYRALAAVVLDQGLAVLFYSEKAFGPLWAKSIGKEFSELKPAPLNVAISMASSLLLYLGMQWLFQNGVLRKGQAIAVGFMGWFLFFAAQLLGHYRFLDISFTTAGLDSAKVLLSFILIAHVAIFKRESLEDKQSRARKMIRPF